MTEEEVKNEQIKQQLREQLDTVTLSLNTIFIIIFSVVLSAISVNKIRVQLLDQINNTDNAQYLPDTTLYPFISSLLVIYSTFIFLRIAWQSLQQQAQASENPNNDINVKISYDNLIASLLVFLAAIIRLINLINTPTQQGENNVTQQNAAEQEETLVNQGEEVIETADI